MNNLFRHIEFLLLHHDCVIVPGLGAFIATTSSARIDMEAGMIFPPARAIMFNQAVTIDDGLLANSYSRKHGLSFEEARMVILRDVNTLLQQIRENGKYECGKLGTLSLGLENRLMFSPMMKSELQAANMGYHPVGCFANLSLSENNKCRTHDNRFDDSAKRTAENKYYHIRINKAFTRMTAALILVFAVAITILLNPIPHDEKEQRASVVPVEALMTIKPKQEAIQDSINTVAEPKSPAVSHDPIHYLIVATFSSAKEAENYASRYSSEEYHLSTVASKRVCRVAVASSDDKEELRRHLNTREISSKFPNAWIWSRN